MIQATPAAEITQAEDAGNEVSEALAAVAAFDQTSNFSNMESDMRALAEKLTEAADAIRESEFERRRQSAEFEDQLHVMRDVLNQRLYGSYELEVTDDELCTVGLKVNLWRRSGYADDPRWSVTGNLRAWAGQLVAAANEIEVAFGRNPGIELYEVETRAREIHTSEFEDVGFLIDNADSEAEAIARVREFLAGLLAAGVKG